jgi:hypothetical protein
MGDLTALQIQGWTLTCKPEKVVKELLGQNVRRLFILSQARKWQVAAPIAVQEPVTIISEVIMFDSDKQTAIDIVPGSQGQMPPADDASESIIRVKVNDKQTLILDARCWYYIRRVQNLNIGLWYCQPNER